MIDLTLLNVLKKKLAEEKSLEKIWEYFLDNFGNYPEFFKHGEPTRDHMVETVMEQVGAEVIQREGLFVKRSLLVGIPEYHFIHGSCEFAGKLINVLYFEDLQQGLICIPSVGKPLRTQYARFTNQMLGRPLGSQDDRFKH